MNKIPSYALYGETAQPVWHESLHVETISNRSGAHDWSIVAQLSSLRKSPIFVSFRNSANCSLNAVISISITYRVPLFFRFRCMRF